MYKLSTLAIALLAFLTSFSNTNNWEYLWMDGEELRMAEVTAPHQFNGNSYLVLQFKELPGTADQANLKASGIELLGYLDNGHYIAQCRPSSISAENFRDHHVSAMALAGTKWVITPLLEFYQALPEAREYSVQIWNPGDATAFRDHVRSKGIQLSSANVDRGVFRMTMNGDEIEEMAGNPAVAFIGPVLDGREPLLDNAINMVRVNAMQAPAPFGANLSGDGIRVGVWDGGLTGNHVGINGNVTNIEKFFYSATESKHPTHVTGIVTGKGHKNLRLKGMAPESEVLVWSFEGDIIDEMQQGVADHGLNVINSSFYINEYNDPIVETMCFFPGFYVLESQGMDKMVRDNPTLVHTVANGNQNPDCQGAGGWSGIPIGLQGAKNIISVGWLDINENFYGGSSVGPTYDGRIKPEVTSKGAQLYGHDLDHGFHFRWGSSGSAPTVAGLVALLQEWYRDNIGGMPEASLMKAAICNTAQDDAFLPGPDHLFGFGRVNGLRALETLQAGNFTVDNVGNSDVKIFTINVPAGVSQLNVCLAWTDKEALPGAAKALVNDLDLRVTAPSTAVFDPWTLNPLMPWLPPVTGNDSINNIEQVTILTPVAGVYTVTVTGKEVAFGPQTYAVNYDIRQSGISMTHPVGGETWVPGDYQFIRWDPNGTTAAFSVDISYDDGVSWNNLANPAATKTFQPWSVIDTTSHVCRIRLTSGIYQTISDRFTIMPRAVELFGQACDEHLLVSWDPVKNADDYIVQLLQDNEYVPFDTITDTMYLFSELQNGEEYWVTVIARDGPDLGFRSNGFMFSSDGSDCNFNDDAGIAALCDPLGFRYAFDGGLPYNASLKVAVRNYGSNSISGFNICYQRQGGPVFCEPYPGVLTGNAVDTFVFSTSETFADTLVYPYKIWTAYGADMNNANDTLDYDISVVPSYPHPLPYYTGFESALENRFTNKAFALPGIREWDFDASSNSGRLSIGILDQLAHTGSSAMTMDEYLNADTVRTEAILNLNLAGYQDSTIYLDFSYVSHGETAEEGDKIWGRADETESWVPLFDFAGFLSNTQYTDVTAVNLTQKLQFENGQTYGDHFQLKFGQEGMGSTIFIHANEGRSIDEVRVYSAGQDLEVRNLQMQDIYCDSINGTIPVTVTIQNNSPRDAMNFTAGYSTGGGFMHSEVIPFLAAYDNIQLTFALEVPYTPGDMIELSVYVDHLDDLYPLNDSITDVRILVQPYAGAEYYEDFEGAQSDYRVFGDNATWERGIPSNQIIGEAASGSNAWVTNLSGRYRNYELSYLLTPCFNLGAAPGNTNLSFNLKLEIEENYDFLRVEYSNNGVDWQPLWTDPENYNWFNDIAHFWDINIDEWEPASTNISLDSLAGTDQVLFRFVLSSDQLYKEEGAGVDDIHLTEDQGPILPLSDGNWAANPSFLLVPGINNWVVGNEIAAAVIAESSETITVAAVKENTAIFPGGNYALKRHFWTTAAQSYTMRVFLPYDEYQAFYTDFPDWKAPSRMSILAYGGANIDSTDSNNGVSYALIDDELLIKPYRNGYMLEFDWSGPGEFYIVTDSAMVVDESVDVAYMTATALNPDDGLVDWETSAESNIAGFVIKAGSDGVVYDSIGYLIAAGTNTTTASYTYTDSLYTKACLMYYKVCAITNSGVVIEAGDDTASFVFPSLVAVDSLETVILPNDDVEITWGTLQEKCNDGFDLFVAINSGPMTLLGAEPSVGDSDTWTPYSFLDDSTPKTDTLCYTLIQNYSDGTSASYGPVCVIFEPDVADTTAMAISSIEVTPVSCAEGSDGAIDITIVNGTAPFTIRWSDGSFGEDLSNLPAGTYAVFIEDADGETVASGLIEVPEPPAIEISGGTVTDILCSGMADGSVTGLLVTGGTPPYTYLWSDGSTDLDNTSLTPGIHQFTVTDDKGCSRISPVYFIQETPAISLTFAQVLDADCNGAATGAVDIEVAGGRPPYSFEWSNGQAGEDLAAVAAGSYSCDITDANDCSFTTEIFFVGEASAIQISNIEVSDVSCDGGSDGAIDIFVSGGIPPYDYLWSNGDDTQDASALMAGDHSVTITDAAGCSITSAPIAVASPDAIQITSLNVSHLDCFDSGNGSIDLEVSGGIPPWTYQWNNGQLTQDIANLSAGQYSAVITDSKGCTLFTGPIEVQEPAVLAITDVFITNTTCFGGSDGVIELEVNGGIQPYSYSWSNGSDEEDINGLEAGSYILTVTDMAECVLVTNPVVVGTPDAIIAGLGTEVVNPACYTSFGGGSIDLIAEGGQPPYTYLWNTGDTIPGLSDLDNGTYTCEITDSEGCTGIAGPFVIERPSPLVLDMLEVVDVACLGENTGAAYTEVSGAFPPFEFEWINGMDQFFVQNLIGIPAGTYRLIVSDANDCFLDSLIVVDIEQPASLLELSISTTPESVFGASDGTATLDISGGDEPYIIYWSNGAGTQDLEDLSAGEYCVEVVDDNGCARMLCTDVGLATFVPEIAGMTGLELYPNPAFHEAVLHMVFEQATDARVDLIDINGRVLLEKEWKNVVDEYLYLNVGDLSAGTYVLKITTREGMGSLPLIIQH